MNIEQARNMTMEEWAEEFNKLSLDRLKLMTKDVLLKRKEWALEELEEIERLLQEDNFSET